MTLEKKVGVAAIKIPSKEGGGLVLAALLALGLTSGLVPVKED
jgi:hypothetical protein